jgi:hypothetical protein
LAKNSGGVVQAVDAGLFTAPPKAHPSRVYVVSYRDGHLRLFSGAPTAAERITARFCYLVDTSEQHATSTCTVTSAVDAYSFSVELSATWRVTDPEAAVRADLSDGTAMVVATLQDAIWQIARGYRPEQAAVAEQAVRASLATQIPLASGITIVRAVARFRADAAVTSATVDRDAVAHKAELDRNRMAALSELFDGSEAGALMIHLLQHPDDTATALGTLKDNREKEQALRLALVDRDRQHYLAMLDRALDNNLINDADAQPLRDILFGQAASATLTGSVTMVPLASRPPLSLPQGALASGAGAASGLGAPSTSQAAGRQEPASEPQVAQGYVVEDVDVPAEDDTPNPPASPPGSAPGGVVGWKPIKKPAQGSA